MTAVTIVWIARMSARVYHFSDDRMEREAFALTSHFQLDAEEVAARLAASKQILILSPDQTGSEFVNYITTANPTLAKRIVGSERLEAADDSKIADYAVKYFSKPVSRTPS